MKISLIWIGKTSEKWIETGIDEYAGRLKHYISFEIREIQALKKGSQMSEAQIKQKEGELLLDLIQPTDILVLLDENGKSMSSRDFSGFLEKQMLSSARRIVFVIGGAYGFSDEVYKKCHNQLSLSKMTFSHQMVRVIFMEQLYRAFTIIKGEPYHHD